MYKGWKLVYMKFMMSFDFDVKYATLEFLVTTDAYYHQEKMYKLVSHAIIYKYRYILITVQH
jgi:hypothetical protein